MKYSLHVNIDSPLSSEAFGEDVNLELGHSASTDNQIHSLFLMDNFSNVTSILNEFKSSLTNLDNIAVLALISLYAVVFLVGLIGNFAIIYFVCKQKSPAQFRARNRVLINLCIADLLVILVCCPMGAYSSATKIWLFENSLCKLLSYFQGMAVTAGTLSLTILSLYRYIFIRYPSVYRKLSEKYILATVITTVWILAALISLPMVFTRTLQELKLGPIHVKICLESWRSDISRRIFTLLTLLIVYVLPCAILIVCHTCVSCTLCSAEKSVVLSRNVCRQRSFRFKSSLSVDVPAAPPNTIADSRSSSRSNCFHSSRSYFSDIRLGFQNTRETVCMKEKHGIRSRRRLANLLMGMTLCFVICWLPYNVTSFYVDLYPTQSLVVLLPFTLLLGHSHSAVNPLVYWIMNRRARTRIKDTRRTKSTTIRGPSAGKPVTCLPFINVRESTFTSDSVLGVFHPKYALREFAVGR